MGAMGGASITTDSEICPRFCQAASDLMRAHGLTGEKERVFECGGGAFQPIIPFLSTKALAGAAGAAVCTDPKH